MSRSILYYPTIEFSKKDYNWLWNAALFWDKIYRIVPPGYELDEPRNIKAICSTGEIGIPISPVSYATEASADFSDFIQKHSPAALTMVDKDETEYIRIHSSKIDVKLQQEIFYKLKDIDEDENWLYAKPHTVNFYMTFLANHIAKKNSLSLYTNNQELWVTSSYFLYDGQIQDMFFPDKDYFEPSSEALVSVMIPNIYPQNLLDVPPEDILKFREKRKDERAQFLGAIDNLREEIKKADAPEIVEIIMNDEKKKIDDALKEYKKSMDLIKAVKFGGMLTTVLTITADALGYCNSIPPLCKDIFASSGMWAGVLTGIFEKKQSFSSNPYTYLAHVKNSFRYFPAYDNTLTHMELYNYTLSRGFEEFIND